MKIKQVVLNFIPILLLFILLSYTEQFIHVSGSVLGKLLAVTIIIFYTTIDIMHGILAAALVILYYQSDIVESMLNKYEYPSIPTPIEQAAVPVEQPTLLATENKLSYISQYERPTDITLPNKDKNACFRKEHCKKGHLIIKDQKVRIDMTEHVYPEVSFVSDKCNICDSTCDFKIADTIISTSSKEGFAPISCRH